MKNNLKINGFTLIELSIVLIIITMITSGILKYMNYDIQKSQREITEEKMQVINNKLVEYFREHGILPCPGNNTPYSDTRKADNTKGITCRNALNSNFGYFIGTVPLLSLNLSEEYMKDGWNRTIYYAVHDKLTRRHRMKDYLNNDANYMYLNYCIGSTGHCVDNVRDETHLFYKIRSHDLDLDRKAYTLISDSKIKDRKGFLKDFYFHHDVVIDQSNDDIIIGKNLHELSIALMPNYKPSLCSNLIDIMKISNGVEEHICKNEIESDTTIASTKTDICKKFTHSLYNICAFYALER